jgi:hypothetical protein
MTPKVCGVGKPLKKAIPSQAAPGLVPGTFRVQSGALSAWPRCSPRQLCSGLSANAHWPKFSRNLSFVKCDISLKVSNEFI